jgi:periplasmic divalent cation tolerance protein
MENKYCLITTTCDDRKIAEKIINSLLDKKLVSCVQLSNINSSYIWKGKIENNDEILLQMKTKKKLYKKIEEEILSIHNYEVPQILMYDITDGYSQYLKWIEKETIDL